MGISTILPISYLPIILDKQLGTEFMLRHSKFYSMIRYANRFMIILLNINLYVGYKRKMLIKLKGYTYKITHIVAANIPRLPYLILT